MNENKAIELILSELHRAQAKHPGRMILRHQAWGVIEEEHVKFRRAVEKNDYDEAHKRLATTAAMCLRTLIDFDLIRSVESDLTVLETLGRSAKPPAFEQDIPGKG